MPESGVLTSQTTVNEWVLIVKRSRQVRAKILTLLTVLTAVLAVLSCGRTRLDSTTYRLPWPVGDGTMALQDVVIETLTDPEHFSGSSAHVYVEPGDGGTSLAGAEPSGRYVRTGSGVLIPSDYVTLQAVTAYAHVEKLRAFDSIFGADGVLSWPLTLGVEVKLMSYGAAVVEQRGLRCEARFTFTCTVRRGRVASRFEWRSSRSRALSFSLSETRDVARS